MIIAHVSDLHIGKPFLPHVAEALVTDLEREPYDVLVISGDLTQRAKVDEFKRARAFIDALPDRPLVVTVGNHDVPLYRVFERLLTPHKNYREYISDDLNTVTHIPGATIVALDSSAPRTAIVNGMIREEQLEFARDAFRQAPDGDARLLVTHHALARAPDYQTDRLLPGAGELANALLDMGVELVLSGHLHRSYVSATGDVGPLVPATPNAWLVFSGTSTSRRGRARERGRCSYNRIRLEEEHLRVTAHMYEESRTSFVSYRTTVVPRVRP